MRIDFMLPPPLMKAAGGYKVVYQYANALVQNGNDVCIYYDCRKGDNSLHLPGRLAYVIRKLISWREPRWFELDTRVKKKTIYSISAASIRSSDVLIATSIDTVRPCMEVQYQHNGTLVHLIQGHENWFIGEAAVRDIYGLPVLKICVADWLAEKVKEASGQKSYVIKNGIDRKIFYQDKNIIKQPHCIAMLYKKELPGMERKDSLVGIRVFSRMKEIIPDLRVLLFSVDKRPKNIPSWMEYSYQANEQELHRIYNEAAIYVCTSREEGYGLPGLEAMACGCVLVSTNNQGVQEYAKDGESASLFPVGDEKILYHKLLTLMQDHKLYEKLKIGAEKVTDNFSLANQCTRFNSLIYEIGKKYGK